MIRKLDLLKAIFCVTALLATDGLNRTGAVEVSVPRISAGCDAPSSIEIALPAPLPRLKAALAERDQTIRVVAIGSSSTVGVGASAPNLNYPNQLSSLLGNALQGKKIVMLNRGMSGELAAATAQRLISLVDHDQPSLVLWQVGTNDGLGGVPVSSFTEVVRSTVRWLKARDIDVVLVGMQYTARPLLSTHYLAVRDALAVMAKEEDVLLIRRFDAMEYLEKTKGEILLSNDGLHLNDLGYRCMAEHIAKALVVSSFLQKKPAANQK